MLFLRMLFLRLGDTKGIEESHKIGAHLETKRGDSKILDDDVFYARLQRRNTPLQQRGIPHIQVSKSAAYQPARCGKLPASGLQEWKQIYARQGLMKMPPFLAAHKDTVLSGHYEHKTPASGRTSIAAAQALVYLHRNGLLHEAMHAWQAVCCVPHSFIRNEWQVFFVLMEGTYACRLWPATFFPGEGRGNFTTWTSESSGFGLR